MRLLLLLMALMLSGCFLRIGIHDTTGKTDLEDEVSKNEIERLEKELN